MTKGDTVRNNVSGETSEIKRINGEWLELVDSKGWCHISNYTVVEDKDEGND